MISIGNTIKTLRKAQYGKFLHQCADKQNRRSIGRLHMRELS